MSLSHQDQVNLLQDILNNHREDCCGTVSEYEQLERLAQSLLANDAVPQAMDSILQQIHSYSQSGKNAVNPDDHVNAHQEQLSQWVDEMNNYS